MSQDSYVAGTQTLHQGPRSLPELVRRLTAFAIFPLPNFVVTAGAKNAGTDAYPMVPERNVSCPYYELAVKPLGSTMQVRVAKYGRDRKFRVEVYGRLQGSIGHKVGLA